MAPSLRRTHGSARVEKQALPHRTGHLVQILAQSGPDGPFSIRGFNSGCSSSEAEPPGIAREKCSNRSGHVGQRSLGRKAV